MAYGQAARFERFTASLLYVMASGKRIDPDRTERFSEQVDSVWKNPFKSKQERMTSSEIKEYLIKRFSE